MLSEILNPGFFTTINRQLLLSCYLTFLNSSTIINRLPHFVLISYGLGDQKFKRKVMDRSEIYEIESFLRSWKTGCVIPRELNCTLTFLLSIGQNLSERHKCSAVNTFIVLNFPTNLFWKAFQMKFRDQLFCCYRQRRNADIWKAYKESGDLQNNFLRIS